MAKWHIKLSPEMQVAYANLEHIIRLQPFINRSRLSLALGNELIVNLPESDTERLTDVQDNSSLLIITKLHE